MSSMTGLRLGDMQHLRWSDIKDIDGTPTICIKQRKTKRVVSIPLNDLAQSLLPPRDDSRSCKEEEDEVKVSLDKKIQAVSLTDWVFG